MPVFSRPLATDTKTVAILGDSGIILGFEDAQGCRWNWASNDPWSPSPSVRAVTGDRANAHGSWDATKYYGPRNPQFQGTVVAPSHAALHEAKQRLFDAITVEPFQLRVIEPGYDRIATVRRDGEVLWTEMRNRIAATYSLSLFAGDPVAYATTEQEHLGPLNEAPTLTNSGGLACAPVFTIVGPTHHTITLTNVTTGRTLTIKHPTGLPVVGAATSLVVDMGRRSAVTGTGTSRRSWVSGQWWPLVRGANAVTIAAHSEGALPADSGVLTTWREGWI